jgi:WD40 repeat protein
MRHAVWVGLVAILVTGGTARAQERKPEILKKLEGHRGGVSALAFNPKVSVLATGSGNGVVRLWEVKSGEQLARMDSQKPTGARINHLGFSANGELLSASSRNAVVVFDALQPKDNPEAKESSADSPARQVPVIFDDGLGNDSAKLGVVTGDGKRVFLSATEGVRISVGSRALAPRLGADTLDDLKGTFMPWAIAAVNDGDSALVALYGSNRSADKSEQPAIAFVGLGDGRVVGRGVVRAPIAGRPISIGFAPDGKWLVACNGEDLMYWRVPGSQVVEGDPKILLNSSAFVAAAGPNGRVAYASPPEDGKTVKVTLADFSGTQPKVVAVFAADIARVSALAFSPDGAVLAVGDDVEGVVQLWNVEKK